MTSMQTLLAEIVISRNFG